MNIKLTPTELNDIQHLRSLFLNKTIKDETRQKVFDEICRFWDLIESKNNLSIKNIIKMKPDGTLILR